MRYWTGFLLATALCGCTTMRTGAEQEPYRTLAAQSAQYRTRVELQQDDGSRIYASYDGEEDGCRSAVVSFLTGASSFPEQVSYRYRFCDGSLREWEREPSLGVLPAAADAPLRLLARRALVTGYASEAVDGLVLSARQLKKRELSGKTVQLKVMRGREVIYRSEIEGDAPGF